MIICKQMIETTLYNYGFSKGKMVYQLKGLSKLVVFTKTL